MAFPPSYEVRAEAVCSCEEARESGTPRNSIGSAGLSCKAMLIDVVMLAGALSGGQTLSGGNVAAARAHGEAAKSAPEAKQLYRLDLAGRQTLWAEDRPMQSGSMISFHRYPDGVLVSIRQTDVVRIVAARYEASASRAIKPGGVIDLGVTGTGSASSAAGGGSARPGAAPGERKDGTALFNPNRPYRPDWDSKQVPGMNIGHPNSPNDYVEGKTFAYPAAGATQAAPGDLPRAAVETGDPKSPQ